jgi:hypothetical protein
VDVVGVWGIGEEGVDDGAEVVEGGDGVEGRELWAAEGSAGDGEDEGVGDGGEGDAAVMEFSCEATVASANAAGGTRGEAVEVEDALDVKATLGCRCGHVQALAMISTVLDFPLGGWA